MNYQNLKVGQKVYYTGDMANIDDFGKIVNVKAGGQYPVQYNIKLDDGRIFNGILSNSFEGIGKRFWILEEYQADRKSKIEAMYKHMGNLKF